MKDALLLHLDPAAASGWWLATDRQGNGIGAPRHGPLVEAAAARVGRALVVLLPAERCLVLEVRAPVRDRAQLLRALPALVEDRITDDVEAMHLTAGAPGDDGVVRVVAIEHAELEAQLATLAAAGLDPDTLLPDALCLAATPAQLLVLGERALVRCRHRAAAVAPALAPLLLADEPPGGRVVLAHGDEDESALGPIRDALLAQGLEVEPRVAPRHELERALLRGARGALPFDLRHGRHRRRAADDARWRTWRLPAALAAAWLVLATASAVLDVGLLLRERARLDAELAELLPSAAPEALGQPDPRFYLDQRLKRRAGTGGVALEDVVRATGALRAVGGTELMLVDAREGALELAVRAGDLAALEAARGAVAGALGRGVELRGATSAGDRAEARLVVGGGAALE